MRQRSGMSLESYRVGICAGGDIAKAGRSDATLVAGRRLRSKRRRYGLVIADELNFSLLPAELQPPAPLISRYTESDDLERSELLKNASREELRELSEAPGAHWDAINRFLDENVAAGPGPRQDVALALDSFAQAAMEGRHELEGRYELEGREGS